jgi:hypothetical protein
LPSGASKSNDWNILSRSLGSSELLGNNVFAYSSYNTPTNTTPLNTLWKATIHVHWMLSHLPKRSLMMFWSPFEIANTSPSRKGINCYLFCKNAFWFECALINNDFHMFNCIPTNLVWACMNTKQRIIWKEASNPK